MSKPRTILVPTDFSDPSEHALRYAFELAEALGAKIHILHVYTVPAFPDGMALGADVLTPAAAAAEEAMQAATVNIRERAAFGGASVAMGDPRDAIVAAARSLPADLIVIGSHGRRGFSRVLLGSVTEGVLREAVCPVLVVHPRRSE